ncbi:MAG: Asp-tRNA(Asn)/Glu-tRNA(Gln) amidotransferase subunit GatB [Flavobacteriales bacterium]|nr:Asp-tRNA(Asn)/Glu-tRNA(Gln) amidotransferase subunit GatB [Flavobacteriales bacterium]
MNIDYDSYEAVIGLEIHAQLLTKTKAFSTEPAEYGEMPNTRVSVVSLGHPGTLPRHNREAVNMAMKVGLACQSEITRYCLYARKNYFYADLPKGYQITQDKTPLCKGGFVRIRKSDGSVRDIELTRIHMEEDSGKSIHDMDLYDSLIDYNRAGTSLIEIVTEPVMRTGEEAGLFVAEVRKLVRYLEVCDGNMEEGSLRCDANISVRKRGTTAFGTKVEVKNMNSISNVRKAIEFETKRQIEAIEAGEKLVQETRTFDAMRGITFTMRAKELVNDYRYFPEPDLPPLQVSDAWIQEVANAMPALPEELYEKFTTVYGLSAYDAAVLSESREMAEYYLQIVEGTTNFKAAANYLMGPVRGYLNKEALDFDDLKLKPAVLANLIKLIDDGVVSNAVGEQTLLPELMKGDQTNVRTLAESMNVIQNSDTDFLEAIVDQALSVYPDKIEEYRSGKKGLMGLFMGEVMKLSKGKADPKQASSILRQKLDG